MSRLSRDPEVEAIVAAYRADLEADGQYAKNAVTSPARAFLLRVGLEGWSRMSLAEQLALPSHSRRLVTWLIVTCRLQPSPEYLVVSRLAVGHVASWVYPDFHTRFMTTATELGYVTKTAELQWWAIAKVAALAGVPPGQLTKSTLDHARQQLLATLHRVDPDRLDRAERLRARLHGAQTILFHLGVVDALPRMSYPDGSAERASAWASVAPRLWATFEGYIEQMRLSLRPATIVGVEAELREFGTWLTREAPEVKAVADLRREHIERYKRYLAERPACRAERLTKATLRAHLGTLRTCFERLSEWGGEDVPTRVLMFAGDLPRLDDPLPRFIDDAAAAKLLRATREHPDQFTRLVVEFLARTGMRRSEFLDLKVDSVVQIGSAYWLHVPLGKLRTDRYIPLHPQLKELLDEWVAKRPASLREPWLFIEHGRRIGPGRVLSALASVTDAAGISRITPHQLRHTLATQAINRGVSLEAIAALLGHRSMRMTLVYAKIANRTVAAEYFKVSEKVEALYDAPKQLPPEAEGTEMRKLRSEMHRRMLGNGYCARPVGLDCHFESICESCVYFQTTLEFRPTLQRQRDDAAEKGQVARLKIFDGLLERLDEQAKAS